MLNSPESFLFPQPVMIVGCFFHGQFWKQSPKESESKCHSFGKKKKNIFLNHRPREFLEVICMLFYPPFQKKKKRICFCCSFIYHVSQSLNRQRFSLPYSIFNSLRFVNFLNAVLFLPHHLCWHVYLFLICSPWFVSSQPLLGDLYKYRFYI